jgi:hypothetical protein
MLNVKIAYYRKEDWQRFTEMIDDRESMHDTWEDWHKAFLKAKKDLTSQGFEVTKVVIDLNELRHYCAMRGVKNDGSARSRFIQD